MISRINSDNLRLRDMLNSIKDIEQFNHSGSFEDHKTVMAIAYAIAIIGEAANNLTEAFRLKHAGIQWNAIIGMRHRIIHGYGKVSLERLKETVIHHIPTLKQQIITIMQGDL